VGRSGAGKSTLLGLLLGFHKAVEGAIRVDGELLDESVCRDLRRRTVWVDPAVHLFNSSFLANIQYGAEDPNSVEMLDVIRAAELYDVLDRWPDALQATVGEAGAKLSGGEGQRVRLGRGLARERPALVLLDEPFRGLSRTRRQALLGRLRHKFADSTLLFVTHDIAQTTDFDRVLVIEDGRIVEDASPADLQNDPKSIYRSLLEGEANLHRRAWGSADWRRMRVENGVLRTTTAGEHDV
jgi:ATP-binding cassette subfamily B protein